MNETNRPSVTLRRETGPNDMTFRFPGGFAGSHEFTTVRLSRPDDVSGILAFPVGPICPQPL